VGDGTDAYRVLVGKHEGKEIIWKTPGLDGRIIVKRIFRKCDGKALTGLT
jgi:hypothetical protein